MNRLSRQPWLLSVTLLCMALLGSQSALAAPYPDCAPWPLLGTGDFWPAPTYAQDHTLFAAGWEHINYWEGTKRFYILRSQDGGASWERYESAEDALVLDIAFSPTYANDHAVCANEDSSRRVICSHDGGNTWAPSTQPDTQDAGFGSAVALLDAHRLFLAVQAGPIYEQGFTGLFFSPDDGVTWERRLTGSIRDVAVTTNAAGAPNLLAIWGGYHIAGGILRSTDLGFTWQDAAAGLGLYPDAPISDLTFSPDYASDNRVFVLASGGLFASQDAGRSWTFIDPYASGQPWGEAFDYALSPRFGQDRTIWRWGAPSSVTTDAGASWRALPHPPRPIAVTAAYCPQGDDCGLELFGSWWEEDNDYFAKSFDGGQTWLCLDEPDPPLPLPAPTPPAPEIPEPAAWLLLGSGVAALAGWARRRR